MTELVIDTPEWGVPFLEPCDYKGLFGGRGSGKSHFFGGNAVEVMAMDPYVDFLCVREVQKSLKHSAKKLIEQKIHAFGVEKQFKILESEIRRVGRHGFSTGIMIFQGMQDYNADSIKSLEDFKYAWVEEANRMSQRSLDMLIPTIRGDGSEIWFSWNPDQPTDPVEKFLITNKPDNALVAHINFDTNPFCTDKLRAMALNCKKNDPDSYPHIWLGRHNTKSDDQVLHGKWEMGVFDVNSRWNGPYYGVDWGFSTDPSTVLEVYIDTETNTLYVSREVWGLHVEVIDLPDFIDKMTGCREYMMRADNARPEHISHVVQQGGFSRTKFIAAEKWKGSIEDGITCMRSFSRIIVHEDCPRTLAECGDYKYKRDRLTDDILPDIIDKHNHCMDAIRYALEPFTKRAIKSFWD